MVHTFSFADKHYIYDTGSGSLHECDALTAEVVKRRLNEGYDFGAAGAAEISEIENELLQLEKSGLIFAAEESVPPVKSRLVKALCLHICHDCNLRCEYCFAGEGAYKGERQFMSRDVAKNAIDFLIDSSGDRRILEIDFFGGEPLMNFETVKYAVEYAKSQGEKYGKSFLFTMTTNGLLLSGEIAEFLNREMENVVLSIDGRKQVHDGVRKTVSGKGSYDYVVKNLKNFIDIRAGKSYYVRGTFTAKNLDFSNDVLALVDSGFNTISLEPVVLDESHALHISKDKLPEIEREYKKLAVTYLKRIKDGKPFNFFHFYIDLEGGPCLSKRVNACGAGNEYFSVTPSGNIYPCHQFADNDKYLMGNVFDKKVDENIRSIFKNSSLFTKPKCENCFAKYHCSGGCAANNLNFNGDIDSPYEITCEMMKTRMECALHILAQTKGENL